MARKNDNVSGMIDRLIAGAVAKEDGHNIVDIITFCEDPRYLNFLGQDPPIELWPMQRIVLKMFYRGSEGNEHIYLTDEEIAVLEDIHEKEELDYEGEMAKSELRNIIINAQELMDSLDDDTQLEAWVQSKLTKANDYLNSVTQYLGYQNTKQGPTNEKLVYTLDNGQ